MEIVKEILIVACLAVLFLVMVQLLQTIRDYKLRQRRNQEQNNLKYLLPFKLCLDENFRRMDHIIEKMKASGDGSCGNFCCLPEPSGEVDNKWFEENGYYYASSCYYTGALFAWNVSIYRHFHLLTLNQKDSLYLQRLLKSLTQLYSSDYGIYAVAQRNIGMELLEEEGIISYSRFCTKFMNSRDKDWYLSLQKFYQDLGNGKRLEQIQEIAEKLKVMSQFTKELLGEEELASAGSGEKGETLSLQCPRCKEQPVRARQRYAIIARLTKRDTSIMGHCPNCGYEWKLPYHQTVLYRIGHSKEIEPAEKDYILEEYQMLLKRAENKTGSKAKAVLGTKDSEKWSSVDKEWMDFYLDRTKHISDGDIKDILGKALTLEEKAPGSVSKSFIETIVVMNKKQLQSFRSLCGYAVEGEKGPVVLIDHNYCGEYFNEHQLSFDELLEVKRLGLIEFDAVNGFEIPVACLTVICNQKKLTIRNPEKASVKIGNVLLTGDGKLLYKILEPVTLPDLLHYTDKLWDKYEVRVP